MKITALLAAGLVAITGLAPVALATPAAAQERVVVRERTVIRHDVRRHHRHGYGYGRPHRREVCRIQHRRHRDVRVCRTVYR